jgi:hypothetical protein
MDQMGEKRRRRKPMTSDPDRGVAVNSGSDPQRPGSTARPLPDAPAKESPTTPEGVGPAARPSTSVRNEDVEGAGRNEPDDPL